MRLLYPLKFTLFFLVPVFAMAQHEHHQTADTSKNSQSSGNQHHLKHDTMSHGDTGVHGTMPPMNHAFSLNLPMNRNGSGTAWLPDEAPMYGYMFHSKKWMYMLHGNLFVRYNNQDVGRKGNRGGSSFDAPNWLMAMGQRKVGQSGLFRFSAMLSLDPITVGGNGYPLLFQSGETYKGEPLVDRQHPHDLFAELSVGYTHMISKDIDVFGYLAYPGEPALGGTAFMHRPSSLYNPEAPLGHHWQDATHITFGVATAGVRYKNFKAEGSLFTGREPDEERYGFDKPRFDSWAARLSWNPAKNLAIQLSQAFIKSPELVEPGTDVKRTNASVIHAKRFSRTRMLNTAIVWGYNNKGEGHKEHSVLTESALTLDKNTIYGKYEFVEKSSEELQLDEAQFGHHTKFPVNAITLGYNRELASFGQTRLSIGTQGSVYLASSRLEPLYGRSPWSWMIFIRVNPGLMR